LEKRHSNREVEAQVLVYIFPDFFAISLHTRPHDIDINVVSFAAFWTRFLMVLTAVSA
jgi:hypothetical protein